MTSGNLGVGLFIKNQSLAIKTAIMIVIESILMSFATSAVLQVSELSTFLRVGHFVPMSIRALSPLRCRLCHLAPLFYSHIREHGRYRIPILHPKKKLLIECYEFSYSLFSFTMPREFGFGRECFFRPTQGNASSREELTVSCQST